MMPFGSLVPFPSVNTRPSSTSFASMKTWETCWAMSESSNSSNETGTNVAAFRHVIDGWSSVGESSDVSAASAYQCGVTPSDVTKSFTL